MNSNIFKWATLLINQIITIMAIRDTSSTNLTSKLINSGFTKIESRILKNSIRYS